MKILFSSLGCDKNLVDSEKMLSLLAEAGHEFTDDEEQAEACVVNTCCFIGDAKEESINTLLHYASLKETGSLKLLIAAGCLAERYHKEIEDMIPEVDAIVGTASTEDIVHALEEAGEGRHPVLFLRPLNEKPFASPKRNLSAPGYTAYLKIAEGCNKNCTYCIIPKVRGPYRSIPMENLLEEASSLAAKGVKELILVAQETTLYGQDLYGRKSLAELLTKLNDIEGLRWIRVLYCYPEEIDASLISALKKLPKVLPYLDLPIQHCSDGILKQMGRRTSQKELLTLINTLRKELPEICLRTTLIAGFPGETEEEHEECLQFIKEAGFDRLGVFPYSREEGTPAAKMTGQVHWKTKERWKNELLALQQELVFAKNESFKGKTMEVLIEGSLPEQPGIYVGRTYRDAPEVDGMVFVQSDRELISGDLVKVLIEEARGYDLAGRI